MLESDLESFEAMLDSVSALISRGRYTPSAEATALFFNAMRGYELAAVSAAFSAHVRDPVRGKFAPTPADLIAQIEAATPDGRPGPEEAWAMMPASEAHTVVWTAEMAEAYGICSPLVQAGDRVGARMAFKEAYERLVAQARAAGVPVRWEPSLGSDLTLRKQALTQAVKQGKLTEERAFDACPALPMPDSARLALPAPRSERRQTIREQLGALAQQKRSEAPPDFDPLAWAKALRDAEQAGKDLSIAQRDAWRRALDGVAATAGVAGGFTPIPDHLLPPGMRRNGDNRPEPS